jgi:hypothetical protein
MSGHTIKEAFLAQMLGDVDDLLKRIEHLPVSVEGCERRLLLRASILTEAGDRYGQAVSGFTEEAKTELADHLENAASETIRKQAAAIRHLVLIALETEADSVLSPYREIIRKTRTGWIVAHFATALCASMLTALLILAIG